MHHHVEATCQREASLVSPEASTKAAAERAQEDKLALLRRDVDAVKGKSGGGKLDLKEEKAHADEQRKKLELSTKPILLENREGRKELAVR